MIYKKCSVCNIQLNVLNKKKKRGVCNTCYRTEQKEYYKDRKKRGINYYKNFKPYNNFKKVSIAHTATVLNFD